MLDRWHWGRFSFLLLASFHERDRGSPSCKIHPVEVLARSEKIKLQRIRKPDLEVLVLHGCFAGDPLDRIKCQQLLQQIDLQFLLIRGGGIVHIRLVLLILQVFMDRAALEPVDPEHPLAIINMKYSHSPCAFKSAKSV